MSKKTVLPLVVLTIALVGFTLAYCAGHPLQGYLFNSDALYLPTLFADLLGKGGRLSDWYLTPAPYFFPDFPLYLIAYLSGTSPFGQILVFALLQIVLTAIATFFIVKASAEDHHLMSASLITVALIWLSLKAFEPFVELFTSAFHFGAFLSGMALVALWLHLDRSESTSARRRTTACMCLLAFLTALSDNIFVVQTALPFVATCFLLRNGTASRWRRLSVPAAVLFASALGSYSYKFVISHDTRYPSKLGWAQLGPNIHDLIHIFGQSFATVPLLGIVFFAYACIGTTCLIPQLRKRIMFRIPAPLVKLIVFSLASIAATVAAVLLVGNLVVSPRYLIPVFMWPAIVVVLVLQHALGGKFFWPCTYASGLFTLSLLATVLRLPQPVAPGYYPEQVACIDRALAGKNLHHGIAQYWDAKRIQMLSRQSITLAQYYGDLTPMKWITSGRNYRDAYDFAIIAEDGGKEFKISTDMLTAINGVATERISCGIRTVLIYGPDKLHVQKMSNVGNSFVWQGCQLPTIIGKTNEACETKKDDPTSEGFVTFGPYEPLPAGEYFFELAYVSSKPASDIAGQWDVGLSFPTEEKHLLEGRLNGTASQVGSASGKFTIEKEFNMSKVEIRAFATKGGTFSVLSLRLTRTR